MKTAFHVFPFDLFGSSGTRTGAELLGDAVREMLDDNRSETVPTRARAYTRQVTLTEWTFDTLENYQDWRERARRAIQDEWERRRFLFWISGNHLGALPVYDQLADPDGKTLVLQFDAHLDIYHLSDCTSELSHGNFLLHANKPLPRVINIGHRDLLLPADYVKRHFAEAVSAVELAGNLDGVIERLRQEIEKADRVVIDLDCDVFDVAYFPAIAQSQPCGLAPLTFVRILDAVWSKKVVGFALSEFDTARDVRDQSLATLVWLIEWALLRIYEK